MEFSGDIDARYIMVQTTDLDDAKTIAAGWGKEKEGEYPSSVEIHQGVMSAPSSSMAETFDGFQVWELPF